MRIRIGPTIVVCLASAVVALVAVSGCARLGGDGVTLVASARPKKADAGTPRSERLVAAINDFGVDLLMATSDGAGENVVVSPASVHAALSMTANGAAGETAAEMHRVLRIESMGTTASNADWASLLAQLDSRSSKQVLEVANGLWARVGVAFKKPFLDADRDFFGAQVTTLDFEKDDVKGAINRWVKRKTHGMIGRVVEGVPAESILYLVNAVYFLGEWVEPFESESTYDAPFTRADGSQVDAAMMHSTRWMPYARTDVLQATKLPYQGDDSAYYILLPDEGVQFGDAAASLQGTGFSELRRTLMSQDGTEVALGLPKLDTECLTELAEPLSALGMPHAFDDAEADFTGMADLDVPIYIGSVLHKTKVKVDEKGTEAAAVTVSAMMTGSAAPGNEPIQFVCDRPYLFAIVDEGSGAMLFLGAVNDPTK